MKTSKMLQVVVTIAIVLIAWSVGRVQGQALAEDAFLIYVDAPGGKTTLRCEKGCNWKENWFECSGSRCGYRFNQNGFARR